MQDYQEYSHGQQRTFNDYLQEALDEADQREQKNLDLLSRDLYELGRIFHTGSSNNHKEAQK